MLTLILGLALFLATHLVSSMREVRAGLIDKLGMGPYRAAYSGVALAGLVLIIWGYASARAAGSPDIWFPPGWTRHVAALLMLPVFVLLAAAYLPGRIKAAVKHPMILAVKIWAFAHLIANGDLASILLFGVMLAWAVSARISMKRRPETLGLPVAPDAGFGRNDILAIAIGLVAYLVFALWLHKPLIGVSITGRV